MVPIITLATDFGRRDAYVAAMKGSILSISPTAAIVDVTHDVPPQDVAHGAYVLASIRGYFPEGTVQVAVVDPGVGTSRRAVAVSLEGKCYVGPDNGVLSLALPAYGVPDPCDGGPFSLFEAPLPPGCRAVELSNPRFHLPNISSTFHGRDIFAPAAAHLANGVPLGELGGEVTTLQRLVIPTPSQTPDGAVTGLVVHIDHYGNAVTNIRREHLPRNVVAVEAGRTTIDGLSLTYEPTEGPLALWGSNGTLEIAVRNGNASEALALRRGDSVKVRPCR